MTDVAPSTSKSMAADNNGRTVLGPSEDKDGSFAAVEAGGGAGTRCCLLGTLDEWVSDDSSMFTGVFRRISVFFFLEAAERHGHDAAMETD